MLKKILLMAVIFFSINGGSVFAQEVTVTGFGVDRNSALRDAEIRAVEQVVGVYIDSRTIMSNLQIQLDEVYKKSQGFVKGVKILSEGKADSSTYKVQALIDVDTSPNGKLIDELTMILQLNDPRIAVMVIGTEKDKQPTRDIFAESCLTAKLLSMGFSHVINVKAEEAQVPAKVESADYLVIGNYNKISNAVSIPKFGDDKNKKGNDDTPQPPESEPYYGDDKSFKFEMVETHFSNVRVNLKVDVIKNDTGEIIGTFAIEGNDIHINADVASQNAVAQVSNKAAEKLADTFKKFSSQPVQGHTFTLVSDDKEKLQQCIEEIRELGVVNNVYIREVEVNKAVLTIDSAQKPHAIFMALKARTKLKLSIDNMSANSCKLNIN